jgi:FkbM family methyltransferase
MLGSFIYKLWTTPPNRIAVAFMHRLKGKKSRPTWHTVKAGPLQGHQLYVDPKSCDLWLDMINGVYDSFIYDALLRRSFLSGMTIWDIGAHFGYHALSFSALVGDTGQVVAFEPNPYNIERFNMHLQQNSLLAGRIRLVTTALSNREGNVSLMLSRDVDQGTSTGSHLENAVVPLETAAYTDFIKHDVSTTTIDALLAAGKLKHPDIIKIDVEGSELQVLEGANWLLAEARPLIFMEVHNIIMMFHVYRLLAAHKYEVEILDEERASISRCFIIATPRSA